MLLLYGVLLLLLLSGAPSSARASTGDPYVNEAPLGPAYGCEMHELAYEFAQCARSLSAPLNAEFQNFAVGSQCSCSLAPSLIAHCLIKRPTIHS